MANAHPISTWPHIAQIHVYDIPGIQQQYIQHMYAQVSTASSCLCAVFTIVLATAVVAIVPADMQHTRSSTLF